MPGISWSVVQNVRRKRGLYLLVNYFCLRRQEPFLALPGSPESTWKPPWSSWPHPRKAIPNTRLISVRNRSVFQQSDSLLSLPLSPCWLRKGRPEINRLCKRWGELELQEENWLSIGNKAFPPLRLHCEKESTLPILSFSPQIVLSENYSKSINQPFCPLSPTLFLCLKDSWVLSFLSMRTVQLTTIEFFMVAFPSSMWTPLYSSREQGSQTGFEFQREKTHSSLDYPRSSMCSAQKCQSCWQSSG